ncbi:Ig-like domain-containing protein [Arthrobacter sp. ISL-5]|nr:Ig-like domain-containing protein [Arthrobacter sp. ISL-5]
MVTGTSPAPGATDVAVTVWFSEAMDASTVTSDTFTLKAGRRRCRPL